MPDHQHDRKTDDLRDRMDRPTPHSDPAEGDEETVEESLRQKEEKKRTA
jgi:hypothetical protein